MLFINKLFNSIACLLSFTNLQLVIPGRTWILLYLGRTVYKRLWACLALYMVRNQVRVRVRYEVTTRETSRVDHIQTHSNCIENKPKRPVTGESI